MPRGQNLGQQLLIQHCISGQHEHLQGPLLRHTCMHVLLLLLRLLLRLALVHVPTALADAEKLQCNRQLQRKDSMSAVVCRGMHSIMTAMQTCTGKLPGVFELAGVRCSTLSMGVMHARASLCPNSRAPPITAISSAVKLPPSPSSVAWISMSALS